ncbi:hypothetical protein CATMIT_02697 [Catenibacterium mitsuokai DSM 15897]|nr:hypothetical protein CATMIT_02697 [Catenibacterium mitsuokai DSM 15897]
MVLKSLFPSPTGVNYYEYSSYEEYKKKSIKWFPSPTGVNYYEYVMICIMKMIWFGFPSPTGVNYYEYK